MLSEQVKYNLQVFCILLRRLTEDQDVIQVNQHKLAKMLSKHIIHDILEGGRCISQPKCKHPELVQSQGGLEGCLGDILILDSNLVII